MQPAPQASGPASSSGTGGDRPRFRQDLIAEMVELQGARFIDVMAPEGDNVFRFYEVEYSLACGMDGERDVAGIVRWAQDELGLTPSPQEVRTVIAALGELGFIEPAEAAAPELAAPEPTDRAARPTPVPDGEPAGADRPAEELGASLAPGRDLTLGAAGPPRAARPTPQPHDAALPTSPASSSSDVSIDLSDHIAVRPDDVKEAVRASKVMSAVEAPEMIQDPPTAPASAFDAPTVARIPDPAMLAETTRPPSQLARPPEPARASDLAKQQDLPTADTIRVGKTSLRAPATPVKPPVELPAAPVTVKVDRPMPPPNQRAGVSPLLLVVLILAFLGAAVFFAWKYVLDRSAVDVDTTAVPVPVKPAPPPPPPPPPPSAKIVLETPDPEDVKVTRKGVIETIHAENAAVKETEVIAWLKGNKPLEAQVAAMTNDINRQKALLDAATKRFDTAHAAGNKAAEAAAQTEIAERHKLIEARENQLNAKSADRDAFLVHASKSGTFVPSVKANATVAADAVIGKIVREAIPVATFKFGSTYSFAANASVEISIHKGEQRLTCTVADVQADSVKVICPVDPELTEGTEVALQAPAAATAAPPEPPPLPSGTPAPGGTPGTEAPSEPAGGGPASGGAAAPGGTPGGAAAPSAPAEAPPPTPAVPGGTSGGAAPPSVPAKAPPTTPARLRRTPGGAAPPRAPAAAPTPATAPAAPDPATPAPSGSAAPSGPSGSGDKPAN